MKELDKVLDPESSEEEILAALSGLEEQCLNGEILRYALQKLRERAELSADLCLELHELGRFSIDCSGTGGSGMAHFNTSTSVAFVIASAGFKVAKFGGRAASGRSGSFDFLEGLGLSAGLPVQQIADALSVCGLAFIYAPGIYPCLGSLAPSRRKFGKPTLFNYVGPLLNPVRPASRLMGISSDPVRKLVSEELLADKTTVSAILVTAGGKLDEFAVDAVNEVSLVEAGELQEFRLDPAGLLPADAHCGSGDLNGYAQLDVQSNLRIFREIVDGDDSSSPIYKMILLNAAAAFFLLKAARTIEEGMDLAAELIAGGALAENLATCRRFYDKLSG